MDSERQIPEQPFRLKDGSFHSGEGLQPGVEWGDLTLLAYGEGIEVDCEDRADCQYNTTRFSQEQEQEGMKA